MLKKLLFLPAILGLLLSCNQENAEGGGGAFSVDKNSLPPSNGGRLDIIVVAEDATWSSEAGDVFRKYFTRPMLGLPQAESLFNVRRVKPNQFNDLLKRSRNVVILEDKATKAYSMENNKWARPQIVVNFRGQGEEELAEIIEANQAKSVDRIKSSEVQYLQRRLTKEVQPVPQVLKKHNVSMEIPKGFELENEQDNLLVFWKKALRSDQGIIIHFEPIEDDQMVIGSRIVPLRDSLTKLYIPGENEGSYMRVEDLVPPAFENTELDGHFAIETRGLWRTEGDFMGGPFISYTIFDEDHNQRIMLDAFIFAPDLDKRSLVLEMEAILKTFETTN